MVLRCRTRSLTDTVHKILSDSWSTRLRLECCRGARLRLSGLLDRSVAAYGHTTVSFRCQSAEVGCGLLLPDPFPPPAPCLRAHGPHATHVHQSDADSGQRGCALIPGCSAGMWADSCWRCCGWHGEHAGRFGHARDTTSRRVPHTSTHT